MPTVGARLADADGGLRDEMSDYLVDDMARLAASRNLPSASVARESLAARSSISCGRLAGSRVLMSGVPDPF